MAMELSMNFQQRMEMRLKLAPQIIQSIEILQLNTIDLRAHVEEQMLENPALELEEEVERAAAGEEREKELGEEATMLEEKPEVAELVETADNTPESLEREIERLESLHESWREFSGTRRSGGGDKDRKMEAMQNAPERDETLQEHIAAQLLTAPELDDRQQAIGEFLAYNLDGNGFLRTQSEEEPPEAAEPAVAPRVAKRGGFDLDLFRTGEITDRFAMQVPVEPQANPSEVEQVLNVIQTFDPPGVGARDLKECLLIQMGMASEYSLERKIIRDHLEDIFMNRLPRIAKATGEPVELVDEAIKYIRLLNPRPGSVFAPTRTQYVVPDIVVQQIDDEWQVILEDSYIPHVRVSPHYAKMLKEKGNDPKVVSYVKKKIEAAKFLMEAIEQRQSTLRRISQQIVDFQKSFFEVGVDALRPLKMQYIADRVGVHVSTVSRAISGKYMQTPRGIFALRYFFKGGSVTDTGTELSIVAIKQRVEKIVADEDKAKPLSDEDIAGRLKAQGLEIARRTITKYRKQLNIPSSRQRRRFV